MKTKRFKAFLYRLFWVMLFPLYIINVLIGLWMLFPYWLFTGGYYLETDYYDFFNNWFWHIYEKSEM